VPSSTRPKAKASQSNERRAREEEAAKPHRREHREPSVPARSGGRAHTTHSNQPRKPPAAEPTVPLAQLSPAAAEAVKRQRRLQQHHTSAEEGKARQEALQTALGSDPVQNLVKAWEPNFRRSFEFFQRWKPSASGEMTLAGFILLGECFGLLEKDDLKVAFKRGAGNELSLQNLPNVLMHCVARSVEVESLMLGIPEEGPVTDQEVLQSAFTDLCRHMMLNNGRSLGKCLDGYRRAGHVLQQFAAELPEKYLAQRADVPDPTTVDEAKAGEPAAAPATDAEGAKTDKPLEGQQDPSSKEEPTKPPVEPSEPSKPAEAGAEASADAPAPAAAEPSAETPAADAPAADAPAADSPAADAPSVDAPGAPATDAAADAPADDAPAEAPAESPTEAAAAGAGTEAAAEAAPESSGAPAETPGEAPAAPAEATAE